LYPAPKEKPKSKYYPAQQIIFCGGCKVCRSHCTGFFLEVIREV